MMRELKVMKWIAALILISPLVVNAQTRLAKVFGDHMVLQRNETCKIWGTGEPTEAVSVSLNATTVSTQVGADGRWILYLPEMPAGGPYDLSINSDTTYILRDIYIGDVWIAGGQSNMEWKLSGKVDNMEKEIANSDIPQIRFLNIPNNLSPVPLADVDGELGWKVASPETSPDFSAVAWFFAKRNHTEKNVAVGIIESNWGGSLAEAWTSIEVLDEMPEYHQQAQEFLHPAIPWMEKIANNKANEKIKWEKILDYDAAIKSGIQAVDYADNSWATIQLPNKQEMYGIVWVRKTVKLNKAEDFRLNLGALQQEALVFFNGELVFDKTRDRAIEVIEIPDSLVRVGDNLIACRVVNSWNLKAQIGKEDDMWLASADEKIALDTEWKWSNSCEAEIPPVVHMFNTPTFLYNAMIVPIAGYTARGVIWYQGESNTGRPEAYRALFSAMIENWRSAWDRPQMSFLYVQLANFMDRSDQPTDSNWARLREAQTQTLSVPKTGMATIIDIGDAKDVHPKNKKDVGDRLWLSARKVSYGESLVYAGPTYQSYKVKGRKVILSMDQIGGGLKTSDNQKPKGFAIAGEDSVFYWADAVIKGDKILLSSDQVDKPVAIRYAWADNPAVNLYNMAMLPAVPFRTDDW